MYLLIAMLISSKSPGLSARGKISIWSWRVLIKHIGIEVKNYILIYNLLKINSEKLADFLNNKTES